MKYIAKFIDYIDESTFIGIIALALFILVGSTFSNFLVTSNDHRATQMYIGELKYSLKVDNNNSNIIVSKPGINEYNVEINSLNRKNTFYKLVYLNNENLDIKYRESYDKTEDSIDANSNKKIVLLVNNKSNNDIVFDIKVVGGFETNGIDGIGEVVGYSFIDKIESKSIFDTILSDNIVYPDNIKSDLVTYENGIDFTNISGYSEYTENIILNQNISLTSDNDKYVSNEYVFDSRSKTYTLLNYSELKSYEANDINKYTCDNGSLTCNNLYKINSVINNVVVNADLYTYKLDYNGNINGNGLYYTEDIIKTYDINLDGKGDRVYYFRGDIQNNYVMFSNNCFKIIRTNEDNSIRLIYTGKYRGGMCSLEITSDLNSKYNLNHNDNAYVGYMFGNTQMINYDDTHTNLNESNIKTIIDMWYKENIKDESLVVDSIYCNDRSTLTNGYSTLKTKYNTTQRVNNGNITFRCENKNDRFTVNNNLGNKNLKYPVGLITVDELIFSGLNNNYENGNNYLNSINSIYTMSPYVYDNYSYIYTFENGKINYSISNTDAVILPVISIKGDAIVASGLGTYDKPYIIK